MYPTGKEQYAGIEFFSQSYIERDVVTAHSEATLLLLHVTPERYYAGAFAEPIGIEQLAGTLIKNNVPVNITLGLIRNPDGVSAAVNSIEEKEFTYVGIGMPIGTLEDATTILEYITTINQAREFDGKKQIGVFLGGNLPTNLPVEHLASLLNKFPFATVVRGWGDEPLVSLLRGELSSDKNIRQKIQGLVWKDENGIHANPLDPKQNYQIAGKPVRLMANPDMQVFIEGSRDCSHPFCTFCARMPYSSREIWKPTNTEEVAEQMATLADLGVKKVNFTDEEALGTTVEHATSHGFSLARAIKKAKNAGRIPQDFGFAFSTRSDSVIGLMNTGRLDVLEELRDSGLTRVFLGIESGIPIDFKRWDGLDIPPQGKRYGKGITLNQHLTAVHTLFNMGIELEIGFITFDPLMDLGELEENAHFLLDNNLARHASEVFNRIRLQAGARYMKLADHLLEKLVRKGQLTEKPNLFREFNPSTLKVDYDFLHPLVGEIVDIAFTTAYEVRRAAYALKSYYRSRLITGEPTEGRAFETLIALRTNNLHFLLELMCSARNAITTKGMPSQEYDRIAPEFRSIPEVQQAVENYRTVRSGIWDAFLTTDIPGYLREVIMAQLVNSSMKKLWPF